MEKAHGTIGRHGMWQMLRVYGVEGKLLKTVHNFSSDSKVSAGVGFSVNVGLWQGCVMSPFLFRVYGTVMYMDGGVREVNASVLRKGLELLTANGDRFEITQLLFAVDTALVADSEKKLCRPMSRFCRECERKLRLNVGKSKVMRWSRYVNVGGMHARLNDEQSVEVY